MRRFAADENFHGDVLAGLFRSIPGIDVIRIQDTEIYQRPDSKVLEWTAQQDRILLTRDRKSMPDFVYERVRQGLPMPSVVILSSELGVREAIDELVMLIECTCDDEWQNLIFYLPL